MTKNIFAVGLLLLAGACGSAFAAQLGDPAAPLNIKEWLKGQSVDIADRKNIYVVEFWATACPPCKDSIPYLTELQKKYKDKGVVIIGITSETPEKTKPFVEKMGDKMDYGVACDNGAKTGMSYMRGYGQEIIPLAFLVDRESKVIWYGYSMDLGPVLEELLAGKYTMEAMKKKDTLRLAREEYVRLASRGESTAKAKGKKVLEDLGESVPDLTDFAFQMITKVPSSRRDYELAKQVVDKAEKVGGGKNVMVLGARAVLLFESGKPEEGMAMIKEAIALSQTEDDKLRYNSYLQIMEIKKKTLLKKQP